MRETRGHAIVLGLFVLSLSTIGNCTDSGNGCIFNVTNSVNEKHLPVPLHNDSFTYKLAVPHHGTIQLKKGQSISLICSGKRNSVRQTQSNVTSITCIEGDKVKLFRNLYKFGDLQCRNIEKGSVLPTQEVCGNGKGLIYNIGYVLSRTEWVTLITVCYMPKLGNTLYTRHTIHGKEIKYASKSSYRPAFSTAGQDFTITSTIAYKQPTQKTTFAKILGSSLLAGEYINDKSYLAKGHLSPDADFILATAQFATHYFINAAPQWQKINGASWKSIENTVRNLAAFFGDLEIYTGTHGILSYRDHENNLQNIYLGSNGILPVPKYFWKVAYEPKTKKAVVFVILNDPFVKQAEREVFCQDICEETGFRKAGWKDASSGYVFCCAFDNFRESVDTVPKLKVIGVLSDPDEEIVRPLKKLRINSI